MAINDSSIENIQKRLEAAKKNSWDNRISEMSRLINKVSYLKNNIDFDWREKFVKLFKKIKRKALKVVFIFGFLYCIVFYTPLVWFLAEPLKISQNPQNADAIVVFAGGVGESGKAGQGYEERVCRAVELYKQGYADKLIFSSGYAYFIEEALVMKAVAVSLKVPETSIILENKAKSTYENVKFTKEILDNRKMKSILLVSSPYHMRRALLVFNKAAKGVKVICAPVPNSLFYAPVPKRREKVNLEQIRGIVHEYLCMLYYWWKGWL